VRLHLLLLLTCIRLSAAQLPSDLPFGDVAVDAKGFIYIAGTINSANAPADCGLPDSIDLFFLASGRTYIQLLYDPNGVVQAINAEIAVR
jgi:hypothetical protein